MARKSKNTQGNISFELKENLYESIERVGDINCYYCKGKLDGECRYAKSAGYSSRLLRRKSHQHDLCERLYTVHFAAEMKCKDLYKAFSHSWNGVDPNNIHDHCIQALQCEFKKQHFSFAEVKWEKEQLYFIWKVNSPIYIKDKLYLCMILFNFSTSLEKLNIEGLTFCREYTSVKRYKCEFLL